MRTFLIEPPAFLWTGWRRMTPAQFQALLILEFA